MGNEISKFTVKDLLNKVLHGSGSSGTALNTYDTAVTNVQISTLLSGVGTTGTSVPLDVLRFKNHTIHLITSGFAGAGSSGTAIIESSIDNSNWSKVSTSPVTSDGVTEVTITNTKYAYLRAAMPETTDVDSLWTITIISGN